MKSEKQILAKLEEVVDAINKIAEQPQDAEPAPLTDDQQKQVEKAVDLMSKLAAMALLAWVCDSEEAFADVMTQFRTQLKMKLACETLAKGAGS